MTNAQLRGFTDVIFFILNRQCCTKIPVKNQTKPQTEADTNNSDTDIQENGTTGTFPRFITSFY